MFVFAKNCYSFKYSIMQSGRISILIFIVLHLYFGRRCIMLLILKQNTTLFFAISLSIFNNNMKYIIQIYFYIYAVQSDKHAPMYINIMKVVHPFYIYW